MGSTLEDLLAAPNSPQFHSAHPQMHKSATYPTLTTTKDSGIPSVLDLRGSVNCTEPRGFAWPIGFPATLCEPDKVSFDPTVLCPGQ